MVAGKRILISGGGIAGCSLADNKSPYAQIRNAAAMMGTVTLQTVA